MVGHLLRRRRRAQRPDAVEELGGFVAGAVPVALSHRDERALAQLDIEEGAIDPDEVDDLGYWDEGADDEV